MYIGSTDDGAGLHNMVFEVADNAINEALLGYCDLIELVLNAEGSVTVRDNGRGIPTHVDENEGISVAEFVMTRLHAGGRYGTDTCDLPGRLHGVGLCVVNALSEWINLRIWREGNEYQMRFRNGQLVVPLAIVGQPNASHGTEVTFLPSAKIFSNIEFDLAFLAHRIRERASLKPAVTVVFTDSRDIR